MVGGGITFLRSDIVTENLTCALLLTLPEILTLFLSIFPTGSFWKMKTGSHSLLFQNPVGDNESLSIYIGQRNEIQNILNAR